MPGPVQHASAAVWAEEEHVAVIRQAYRAKFDVCDALLAGPLRLPPSRRRLLPLAGHEGLGGGEEATLTIWKRCGVKVIPGVYLAHEDRHGVIRVAPTSASPWWKTRQRSGRRSSVSSSSHGNRSLRYGVSGDEPAPCCRASSGRLKGGSVEGWVTRCSLSAAPAPACLAGRLPIRASRTRPAAPSATSSGPSAPSSRI